MSPTCLDPLLSSSDKTLASKVKEATRKKKSFTPSPGQKQSHRVYWENKTWKWKAFRLDDRLFISHLTLQTRPSTLLWFPQRASWLPAQSEPTGQETEEQNTDRARVMSHCRATSATSQPIINNLTDQNETPQYLAFYRRLKLKAEIFLLLLKSVMYDDKSFYY